MFRSEYICLYYLCMVTLYIVYVAYSDHISSLYTLYLYYTHAYTGQLLVWEWKSESYILKQQGHMYGMNSISYRPDGLLLATGGEDSKVIAYVLYII